jgi:adenine specific DNA methylase Mod
LINLPVLNWVGKESIVNHDKQVPFRLLKKNKSRSVGESENLIIEGDNLEALKALLPYYQNKIKCIYIDPPYNTGFEDWIYSDGVNAPKIRQWLGKVVKEDDLTRHDKWLCMMYPRLKLLKELLHNEGFIFISIDDNEIHNLRNILNEIFGEKNFRASIIIRRGAKNVQSQFEFIDRLGSGYESILMYSKTSTYRFKKAMKKLEEIRQGSWNNHWRGTDRPTMRYELFGITPEKGQWRWSKERSEKAIKNYKKLLKELGKTNDEITQEEIDEWHVQKINQTNEKIDLLRLSKNNKPEHYIPPTDEQLLNDIWFDVIPNGSKTLSKLLPHMRFENPKSITLIKRIMEIVTKDQDVILDSFAGSGTTGHAVIDLNLQDNSNRKFILIELEPKICSNVTYNRIKKVLKNSPKSNPLNIGFQYCILDKPLFDQDGKIDNECTFEDLASYIYFTETKTILDKKNIKKNFIGEHSLTEYYLIFHEIGKNTLNKKFLNTLNKDEKKVVYADKCTISDDTLKRFNVVFKQITYEVRVF